MKAIITGDIVNSRKMIDPSYWLLPIKDQLAQWGSNPKDWIIERGDYFQLIVPKPDDALYRALQLKALVKKVQLPKQKTKHSLIDVRMAIGIGEIKYWGESIAESNGSAFIHSGTTFDKMKKGEAMIQFKSHWPDVDQVLNLYLRLAGQLMNNWTISSAELMSFILEAPKETQESIGSRLGIKQNSVSGRMSRAHADLILEVENMYRTILVQKRS